MSYETRYAAIREDLKDIINEIAKPFGKDPDQYVGDDCGFEFGVESADGEVIQVTLLLEDGADQGFDGAGNISLRVNCGEETLLLVSPHNYSQEAFADWEDGDLWDDKLDNLRVNIGEIAYRVGLLANAPSSKPSA
ncbi:hypothetical protein D3C71_196850 [compost metagenome]